MESLFAPWRMDYILQNRKGQKCIFCPLKGQSDKKRLIIRRTAFSVVMLNRYPYTYAHLMVAPVRHIHEVSRLQREKMAYFLNNLGQSISIPKGACRRGGLIVGIN